MTEWAPALITSSIREISTKNPLITFPTTGGGSWKVWSRFLALRGASVFDIGNICSTCEFWFKRLQSDADPIDFDEIQQLLTRGIDRLDGVVVDAFSSLLQSGSYRVALFRIVPEHVTFGSEADYFTNEQPEGWPDRAADPPNDPQTSYYRVKDRSGLKLNRRGDTGFEFLVPLQQSEELDPESLSFFHEALARREVPTAVAVGVLDIKGYWDSPTYHWCLSHYLLDGHHKIEAAARTGQPITLLSFLATDHSIMCTGDDLNDLITNYGRETELEFASDR